MDRNLQVAGIELSDSIRNVHRDFSTEGKIDHELKDGEFESLKDKVRICSTSRRRLEVNRSDGTDPSF